MKTKLNFSVVFPMGRLYIQANMYETVVICVIYDECNYYTTATKNTIQTTETTRPDLHKTMSCQ